LPLLAALLRINEIAREIDNKTAILGERIPRCAAVKALVNQKTQASAVAAT
jgi:hypothetical protein